MQPTVYDLVAIANDGSVTKEYGPYYVTAENPWDKWFESTLKHEFLLIHNPGGNNKNASEDGGMWYESMMQFAQFSRMTAYAKAHPENLDAQARADWAAFTRGLLRRRQLGLWTGIYIGGFHERSYPSSEEDTATTYYRRALKEIKPLIDGNVDMICLDAENGPNDKDPANWTRHEKLVYGTGNAAHQFFNYLLRKEIECAIESNTYVDYILYHNFSVLLQTIRFNSLQYRGFQRVAKDLEEKALNPNLAFAGRGDSTWGTGAHAARPLRHCSLHPRVYQKVDTLGNKDQDLRNVDLARENNHIPCVTLLTILKEMYIEDTQV